LSQGIISEGFL